MPAGTAICDKCTDPGYQNTLLLDTIISQERFGAAAVVLQALQVQVKALSSAMQGPECAVLYSVYTRSSPKVQIPYEKSLLILLHWDPEEQRR